jgi:hypothetical protein
MKNNCYYLPFELTNKFDLLNDNSNTLINLNDNMNELINDIFDNNINNNQKICGKKYKTIDMNFDINNNNNNDNQFDFNKLLNNNDDNLLNNNNDKLFNNNNDKLLNNNNDNNKINLNNNDYGLNPILLLKDNPNILIKNDNQLDIKNNEINLKNDNDYNIELMKEAFYSKENIEYIQKSIILKVYNDTDKNIILKQQKNHIMLQIMNNYWLNYCKYLPYDFKKQIEDLNNIIIKSSSEELIKQSYYHLNYLKNKDKILLLNNPINTKQNRNI